jgi:hypothetical protein
MSFDQVRAALGKPDSTSFRQDENSRTDQWSYLTYETRYQQQLVSDAFGRAYFQNIPVRVAVGRLNLEFKDGCVTSIEKTQTNNTP